jgi:NitT/TauT family transport system substrate-binding protein
MLRLGASAFGTLALGGTALGTVGCQSPASLPASPTSDRPEGPPVKVGYLPILDATPLLIAHALGLFQQEGLSAEDPVLFRSWSQLAEAFMAGSVNLVHLLFPIPIYMRYGLGYPAKVVAWNHMNGSSLTVGASSKIGGFEDLGGKQIAVPHWYSQHNVVLQKALRTVGLEPVIQDRAARLGSRQTNLFVMNPPDMPAAVQTGAIDGYTVAEPFNAAGEVLAGARIVRFNGDVWRNHPCCVAVLHEDTVVQQREWAQRAVNAVVAAQQWSVGNKGEAARILAKEGRGYLATTEAVVERAMTKYDLETYGPTGTGAIRHPEWSASRISFQPYPYPTATELLVTLLKETVLEGDERFLRDLQPERVVDDLVEYELVTNAIEKAGGLAGFEGVDPSSPSIRSEQFAL